MFILQRFFGGNTFRMKNFRMMILVILSLVIAVLSSVATRTNTYDDLSGVRVDTASAIKDFNAGQIVIKAKTEVVVRLFGTRLQDVKSVRITKSVESCASGDAVSTVNASSLSEISPPTATFKFTFPDYSDNYYFCIEWSRQAADLSRSRAEALTGSSSSNHRSNRPNARSGRDTITTGTNNNNLADGNFVHQGSQNFLSIATGSKSWFGGR